MKRKKSVNLVKDIKFNTLVSNTQRVAYRLLKASGEWVSRKELERVAGKNAASRVRDLRTESFGGFVVECASATQLSKRSSDNGAVFYYRIQPKSVTKKKLSAVFGL